MAEYFPILIFLGIAMAISCVMMLIPLVTNPLKKETEKLSPFECGFEAFDNAHRQFDVRFYLVAILFVVFDLEIAFLFPWAMAFESFGWFGFASMMIFLIVLTIGFIYEWMKGALEWE